MFYRVYGGNFTLMFFQCNFIKEFVEMRQKNFRVLPVMDSNINFYFIFFATIRLKTEDTIEIRWASI